MKISILGCGWLGIPLASHLIDRNHLVKGSTTSSEKLKLLEEKGIQPFLLRLTPASENPGQNTSFWDSDVLVLNIPPGRSRDEVLTYHPRQVQSVIKAAAQSPLRQVVFISSTSVYPSKPGTVVEEDTIAGQAGRDSGNALLKAEELLRQEEGFETTVLRFGGLYGGDRHPAKYMAGRKDIKNGNAPVNLIHRDDCIAIITQIIEEQITGEIFNAVAGAHPSRREYYTDAAKKLGLKVPSFAVEQSNKQHKLVSNKKLKDTLNYQFIHPDLKLS